MSTVAAVSSRRPRPQTLAGSATLREYRGAVRKKFTARTAATAAVMAGFQPKLTAAITTGRTKISDRFGMRTNWSTTTAATVAAATISKDST